MATLTYRAADFSAAGTSGDQKTVSVKVPTSAASGDLLLVGISFAAAVANGMAAAPSGWTAAGNSYSGSTAYPVMYVFSKVCQAGDPGSAVTFSASASSAYMVGGCVAVAGGAVEAIATTYLGTSATCAPANVTTTNSNDMIVTFWGVGASANPSSLTLPATAVGSKNGSGVGIGASYIATGSAGSYGVGLASTSPSNEWAVASVVVKTANAAPNAPTLTSPANNATIDHNITQRFAWTFSDPDAGDSQSKYDLQYRTVGGSTWTTVGGTTPNTYWDAASGTFAAGDYEWQVRTYDAQGVVGPWSASSFFTAADAPAMPTITAPTSGGTVNNTATLTWSAPNQTDYQWRRVADNAGSADMGTIYQDSGDVTSASTRSVSLTFDTNNRWEHIQVRIKNNGLWSAWADIRVQVSYTQAAPATVSKTPDDATGSILIHITNPTPGTGQPAASYNEVWIDDGNGLERKATMIPPNTDWRFWTPIALRDYDGNVVVKTVGDNGTVVESAA